MNWNIVRYGIAGAVVGAVVHSVVRHLSHFEFDDPDEDGRPPIIVSNGSVKLRLRDVESTHSGTVFAEKGAFYHKGGGAYLHNHKGKSPKRFDVVVSRIGMIENHKKARSVEITYEDDNGATGTIRVSIDETDSQDAKLKAAFSSAPTENPPGAPTELTVGASARITRVVVADKEKEKEKHETYCFDRDDLSAWVEVRQRKNL